MKAPAAPPPHTVLDVLQDVTAWRSDADAQHQAKLAEVDDELAKLRAAMEDIQRQLTALGDFRGSLEDRSAALRDEQARRAHEGIFAALRTHADALAVRAREAVACDDGRKAEIRRRIDASPLRDALAEFTQFHANVASLATLPASYRDALLLHHGAQEASVRAFIEQNDPGPTPLASAPLAVDVVITIDASDGQPELVSVVLPLGEDLLHGWRDASDTLSVHLACKVIEGLYRHAHAKGITRAHALSGGHRGLMAVELELGAADASTGDEVTAAIERALGSSALLRAAQVQVRVHRVPTDYLMPAGATDEEVDDAA